MRADQYPYAWMRRAAGLEEALPHDDADPMLTVLAAAISPQEKTGLAPEEESAIWPSSSGTGPAR
jgi:hypothetical protein